MSTVLASTEQLTAWLESAGTAKTLSNVRVRRSVAALVWAMSRGIVVCLEGDVQVAGHSLSIRVGLTNDFPEVLPFVQLAGADDGVLERFLAHVEGDQNICYVATREVALDPRQPVGLILKALETAIETLRTSLVAPDNTEILQEFANYWSQAIPPQSILPTLQAYFSPDDRLRTLRAWQSKDCRSVDGEGKVLPNKSKTRAGELEIIAVADDPEAPEAFQRGSQRFLTPSRDALYLPLQPGQSLVPPKPGTPWDAADLKRIVRSNLTAPDLEHLEQILVEHNPRRDLIVLGIPRPGYTGIGRYALVAVTLFRAKGITKQSHVLTRQSRSESTQLRMQLVQRADQAFVMRRGGSDTSLSSKRVLLLGVGSLGGHLAVMLASAGIGNLTLVDYDKLSLDNAYRHVLGRLSVGKQKAKGMANLLRNRFPYIKVEPIVERTGRALKRRQVRLEDFDLIVDATGSSTHHLVLADLISEQKSHPPLLLTWLEPLGLGGHVATCFSAQPGCPRCLYSDPQLPLTNVTSFAAAGQELGQDAVGCGSYYTSFADLDSIRTAELTARKAINVLKKKLQENLVFSWRGDPFTFLAEEYELSLRFLKLKDNSLSSGVPYRSRDCANCKSGE